MIRAAARARALAASTNTPIHIMRDGKIVEIRPAKDDQQEDLELTVVRDDTPPYGNQKL